MQRAVANTGGRVEKRHEQQWVLLNYRIPREPSTPRIAVWRRLKNLGVAQISDGLVALPLDARTQEHLEWVAERVREADGHATVWTGAPTTRRHSGELADQMRSERDGEYAALIDDLQQTPDPTSRNVQRWRRTWQRISRRDYFRAPLRDEARLAIADAAEQAGMTERAGEKLT